MSTRVMAAINPPMLKWARESLGYAIGEIADRMKIAIERLRAWEAGDPEERPTVPQVEKLAKVYDQPVSMLYLPTPPTEAALPADFRFTTDTLVEMGISPNLRKVIRRARRLRESALALADEIGEMNERFPAIARRARVTDNAEAIGTSVRHWLGIGDEPHTNLHDRDAAFGHWRSAIEDRGILVFMSMDGLPIAEFRGFALVEERAPTIVINNQDAKPAQLFSLLHELGHIVLGITGICGEIDGVPVQVHGNQEHIETWCNRFAAGALVPSSLLREQPERQALISSFNHAARWDSNDDRRLIGFSRRFAVSGEVIVLRLLAEGAISRDDYRAWRTDWYVRHPYRREVDSDQERKGPGQTTLVPYRLGSGYMRIAFESYWSERVSLYELCHLIGNVKVETARKIETRLKLKLYAAAE